MPPVQSRSMRTSHTPVTRGATSTSAGSSFSLQPPSSPLKIPIITHSKLLKMALEKLQTNKAFGGQITKYKAAEVCSPFSDVRDTCRRCRPCAHLILQCFEADCLLFQPRLSPLGACPPNSTSSSRPQPRHRARPPFSTGSPGSPAPRTLRESQGYHAAEVSQNLMPALLSIQPLEDRRRQGRR